MRSISLVLAAALAVAASPVSSQVGNPGGAINDNLGSP